MKIIVRDYHPNDTQALANIYYHTIHQINIKHYTKEQVDEWAPRSSLEKEGWEKKFAITNPFVAVVEDEIVGFAEFEFNGHIDCFFCHHKWIGKGVGTALMQEILKKAKQHQITLIFAEVSITAKKFFEKNGFIVKALHTSTRNGVERQGFKMELIFPDK